MKRNLYCVKSIQIRSFFPVRILLKSPYSAPYSVRIQENKDQKKTRIWTLFTQCCAYKGVRKISLLENLAYVLNG